MLALKPYSISFWPPSGLSQQMVFLNCLPFSIFGPPSAVVIVTLSAAVESFLK